MTYLWIPAISIVVMWHDDIPVRFEWDQQPYYVVTVTAHWRVDVEWWRLRVWRDYYRLVTHNGYMVVVYRDLLTDGWYLQQLYD